MARQKQSNRKVGRPRTTTPEEPELVKLGQELVKWATEELPKKDKFKRVHFAQWYSLEKKILKKEWDLMLEKPEFQAYYEQARIALGLNYIDGTINPGIAHRFMRHYFPDVKQEENDQVKEEAKLKLAENAQVAEEFVQKYEAMMQQLKALQAIADQ